MNVRATQRERSNPRPCLYVDRGYFRLSCITSVCLMGFDILGTEAHTRASAFLKTDKPYYGDRFVPVSKEGMYTAYFAETELPVQKTDSRGSKVTKL